MAEGTESLVQILRQEWAQITDELVALVGDSEIKYTDWNPPGSRVAMFGMSPHSWVPDPLLIERRDRLLRRYDHWLERFRLVFRADLHEVSKAVDETDKLVRGWLRREAGDLSAPKSVGEGQSKATKRCAALTELLDQATPDSQRSPMAVVDTNALLRCPDLAAYGALFEKARVTLVLTPPVLAELDDLKDRGRTPDVRTDALAVVRRIKGLRDRGSLSDGVKVAAEVYARSIAVEPDFSVLPSWLDPTAPDDRLIGSVLLLQSEYPSSPVVLVTSDINAANKADFSKIPTLDPPK